MTFSVRFGAAGKLALISSAAALTLGATAAKAADGAADAAAGNSVSELVVTRGLEESIPTQLSKFGTRVDTITSRQIDLLGYPDVEQILAKSTPGLYIAPQSGPFSYFAAASASTRSTTGRRTRRTRAIPSSTPTSATR